MDKPLTQNIKPGRGPLDLKGYQNTGGYQALRKALFEMTPQQVQDEVKEANLCGRGGAGVSTAFKWGFIPMGEDAPHPKYFVVNAY